MCHNIPMNIMEFIQRHDYQVVSLLHVNLRKKSYIIKLLRENQFFVLKACDLHATGDTKKRLDKERKFYLEHNDIEIFPQLITYEENALVLEFIESQTLREVIVERENVLLPLLENLKVLHRTFQHTYHTQEIDYYDTLNRYLTSLCCSRPIQAKNIKVGVIDRLFNRIIRKLVIAKMRYIMKDFDDKNLTSGVSHMDFHYNNILVDPSNTIKFIDFENIQYRGYFEFDILYLLVMIEVYISDEQLSSALQQYKQTLFNSNRHLEKIDNLYRLMITLNPQFFLHSKKHAIGNYKKLVLMLKLLFDLIRKK